MKKATFLLALLALTAFTADGKLHTVRLLNE